jgi:hypothetical protein
MLAITSPTSGGRSVGIVRQRTQTMEFFFIKKSFVLNMNVYMYFDVIVLIAFCPV